MESQTRNQMRQIQIQIYLMIANGIQIVAIIFQIVVQIFSFELSPWAPIVFGRKAIGVGLFVGCVACQMRWHIKIGQWKLYGGG